MRPSRSLDRPEPDAASFYRTLVDLAGDLIATLDDEGRFTFVSASVSRILHYTEADLLGQRAIDLVREDRRDEARAFYRLQTDRGIMDTYYEVPVLARHGGTVWLGV